MTNRPISILTFTLILTIGAWAQSPPLEISSRVIQDMDRATRMEISFENKSAKPIAAYVLRFIQVGLGGKTSTVESRTVMTKGLGFSKGRPAFQPGERWKDTFRINTTGSAAPAVDLVVFEDGTQWGEDKARQSSKVDGVRVGALLEQNP